MFRLVFLKTLYIQTRPAEESCLGGCVSGCCGKDIWCGGSDISGARTPGAFGGG